MRSFFALLTAGLLALIVQGGVATFVPPPWCPDLGFLVVLVIGLLQVRMVHGLVLAAMLGFGADLLSGSLFGQHALLRLLIYAIASIAARRINIRGALPLACFGAGATLAYGLLLLALSGFYTGTAALSWSWLADLLRHAAINAVGVPFVLRGVERLMIGVEDGASRRRPLRLEPRQKPI